MPSIFILLVFLGYLLLRKKLYRREVQEWIHEWRLAGTSFAAVLQPHTAFLCVLLGIYVYQVGVFIRITSEYPWLDPSTFNVPKFKNGTRPHDELQQYTTPGWLRLLSMLSPIFIGLTFCITVVHLWLHFPRTRGFDDHLRWFPSYSHDLAMQVVELPLVYGIFALDSVYQMLRLVTGEAFSEEYHPGVDREVAFELSAQYLTQIYSANFQLADLYEAWALRSFGVLCFVRVSRQIRLEVPTVKYILETVRRHLAGVQVDGSRDRRILNDLTILNNPQELLFEPLQQTAGIGVMVFVWTYAVKSLYLLGLSLLADPPLNMQLCGDHGVFPAACSFIQYVDGAAFLASTLAIYNLVVFEQRLKDILRREKFKPLEKFLTVKVMVSIAFFQEMVLTVIGGLGNFSEMQINLCYACLICFEVFPISILVLFAWRPAPNDWYSGDCGQCSFLEGVSQSGQLADEPPWEVDEDRFVASRQLGNMVDSDVTLGVEVAATIELHGRVSAQEGKALEDLVNTMSRTMTAVYKPAALFRGQRSWAAAAGASAGLSLAAAAGALSHTPSAQSHVSGSGTPGCSAGGLGGSTGNLADLGKPLRSGFSGGPGGAAERNSSTPSSPKRPAGPVWSGGNTT